ncbi:2-amino-4-deoxychorismate synthase [Micromonospora sp. MH33]|uniref:anthranilate synthase component I family protein n=1 Tax=Micromonospora sp. MH33 TaxID=1945509 RepID=UPI000D149B91|nr:anthranilate synthase component I family protein [Micromonospora sp. MH33]PSK61839.1 2-amino-4-deoxychorismate synthase [Micromonospora sp. MH33]
MPTSEAARTDRDAVPSQGLLDQARVPVTVRSTDLAARDPLELYASLAASLGTDQVFLLESLSGPEPLRRGSVVGWGRLAQVRLHPGHLEFDGVPTIVAALRRLATGLGFRTDGPDRWTFDRAESVWELLRHTQRLFDVVTDEPTQAYAFGFLLTAGYGAAWHMEDLPPRPESDLPDLTLTLFQHSVWFEARSGRIRHLRGDNPDFPASPGVPSAPEAAGETAAVPAAPTPDEVSDNVDRETFLGWVRRCLEHIHVGDIYQIQVGHRIDVRTSLTPLEVYRRLRSRNPSPHMYLLPYAGSILIGASPELLFRTEGDLLVMRPIAGTTRRDPSGRGNDERVQALLASTKERAEHIMLVDLCRNDVSRVARPHSLAVDRLMAVETFSHVFHLVSTVSARMDPATDVWTALRATFPAGTMTGAPKLRAMEIINEIERDDRGSYAGTVGLVDARGWSELALCIRTVRFDGARYSTQSSAGIVAQSDPEGEWAETLHKMSAAYWALTGEELLP